MSTIKVDTITSVNDSDSVAVNTHLQLKEQSATPTSTSHGVIYVDTGGALKYQNGAINSGNPVTISSTGVALASTNTFTRGQLIDGSQDEIQLRIQGHSTQDTSPLVVENSGGTDMFTVSNTGDVGITNDLALNTDASVFSMGVGGDFTITHGGVDETFATIAASPITINSTGDLTLDSTTDIVLDADGDDIKFKAGSGDTTGLSFTNSSGSWTIKPGTSDSDLIFAGNDGGGNITALTLDMSAAGAATFNSTIGCTSIVPSSQAATFNMNSQILDNAILQSYKETIVAVTNSSGTVTFDMAAGNVFASMGGNAIGADVTVLSFTGMTAGQSATWIVEKNGARDITFATVKVTGGSDVGFFPSGEVPDSTAIDEKIDIYTFFMNSDDNIYVMVGGLNFGAN